jgi:large subunit ribosomal protein L21
MATTYAIISVSGKQYRVREGERLLVDRLGTAEGKTFQPEVLLVGDGAATALGANGVTVTARVVGHVLGEKIRIGKYRPKSGYRRHNGYRSRLSQIEIESIGAKKAAPKKEAAPAAKKEAAPSAAAKAKPAAAKPKPTAAATAEKKAPARRTRRTTTPKEAE